MILNPLREIRLKGLKYANLNGKIGNDLSRFGFFCGHGHGKKLSYYIYKE